MSSRIPLSIPSIKGNEWTYIKECLDTEWVSSAGAFVNRFEKEIAGYTGASHAMACVNGTCALHIALLIAGVRPGDEVIVPTLTFIAPVNAVHYAGAEPVLMDCDRFYNIDVEKTAEFIETRTIFRNGSTFNTITRKRVSAILPVHVFGNAADLGRLSGICRERNIRLVEDATESLGTFYLQDPLAGKHTGTIGDVGCLSFNGNKIITTGGGGMILTGQPEYARKAKYLTTQAKDDEVFYIHHDVGYNYRLTNIQAALGVAQLENLTNFLEVKKRNYDSYRDALDGIHGLHLAETPSYARNNHWMYALQINPADYGRTRNDVMAMFHHNGIETRPVWELNHRQRPYAACQAYKIENAPKLLDLTLNLPCSVALTSEDIRRVAGLLRK
jgi:perosamine synthetase